LTFTACNRRIAAALMAHGWRLWRVEVVGKFVDWVLIRDVGATS
jgi:hypothetical protein